MNFLKNISLLLIISLICIICLEIASRALKLHSDTDPTYIMDDPVLPFSMKPNSQSKSIYGKIFKINNHGLRGPDFYKFKKDEIKRILILGDSVTYGYCVNYSETFSGILHEQLSSSGKLNTEIINAGHNGFNIKDSANYYEKYGKEFDPDIVIIAITASDNTSQSIEYLIKDGIGYSKNSKWVMVPPFIKSNLRNSSLYMTIGLAKARIDFMRRNHQIDQYIDDTNTLINSVKVDIENLNKYSSSINTPLWIISVPSKLDVEKGEYYENLFNDIQNLSKKLNIPFIDTLKDFDNTKQNYCLNDGAHPSQIGHSVIANNLYKKILDHYQVN